MLTNLSTIRQLAEIQKISTTIDVIRKDNILKRRINQTCETRNIHSDTVKKIFSTKKRKNENFQQSSDSSAKEIYFSITNSFDELIRMANVRPHPIFFSTINSEPTSKFNNIDLKRHQNYFNQMMNYDTPSGSWIDINT